jgi:dTDP-4-dehydrorhamnose reductase
MGTLVLGSNGLLGSNLVRRLLDTDTEVIAGFHSTPPEIDVESVEIDVRDSENFETILRERDVECVINAAAMTDVDGCEDAQERAFDVNGEAPGRLAKIASEYGARFVHVSTDYVFDGRATEPYDEAAEPNPIQAYGESKRKGEKTVLEAASDALVPRLSFVYGRRGDTGSLEGFPAWVSSRLESNLEVPLFTDQRVSPTRAGYAAESILELLDTDTDGVIHVSSQSCVSPYEFGQEIAAQLEFRAALLSPTTSDSVERAAERPAYTCLSTERLASALGREPPTLAEDLAMVF